MLKFLIAAAGLLVSPPTWVSDGWQLAFGRTPVEDNCAKCHAVDLTGAIIAYIGSLDPQ